MYIPEFFKIRDKSNIVQIISEYPLATIVSSSNHTLLASHIPLLLDENNGSNFLSGHLSNQNPQLVDFNTCKDVLAIFQGPHAYIPTSYYSHSNAVPTWDYIAVHVYGHVSIIYDKDAIKSHLMEMYQIFEGIEMENFNHHFADHLLSYITCFKIEIIKIEAQFKLSQNKSNMDKKLIVSKLRSKGDENSLKIAKLIEDRSNN